VVVDFTTPPNSTFQAITPPAGATCTTPAVGAAGTIVCTVAAGASSSFSITVNINPGTTAQLVCGLYDVYSTQETALIGSKIVTTVGCAADTDCSTGQWCDESTRVCSATLANGVGLPTDAPHTSPTLNGMCTSAAGALVCASAVCDSRDSKCGYLVGSGPCTAANEATTCRSGVCSTNNLCQPAGGCNVDADCSGGNWCNEGSGTCTAQLANGAAIPTDAPHTSPTLNGVCSTPAAVLVCTSDVCDATDNECGLLNSHGTCTVANEQARQWRTFTVVALGARRLRGRRRHARVRFRRVRSQRQSVRARGRPRHLRQRRPVPQRLLRQHDRGLHGGLRE
jgi:hypothetical protein